MAEEKSVVVYGKSVDSQEKFDYFVATITGALVAYSLQSYQPAVWGWNAPTLEPVALVILFFSFYFGMMRIQAALLVLRYNCDSLRDGELASDIWDAMENKGEGVLIEPGTGRRFTSDQFPALYEMYKEREISANATRDKHSSHGNSYYWWRNHLLIAGFLLLLLAKVLKPYWE